MLIPAGSAVDIELKVSRRKSDEVILLEPLPSLNSRNVAGAKCLVSVKRGRAPIRLLNPTSKDVYIPGHRVVSTVDDVDSNHVLVLENFSDNRQGVQMNANVCATTTKHGDSDISDDIEFNVSIANLSEAERIELLQNLQRNRDVFSASLQSLGKTDLYRHTIDTVPGAPPVHLPFTDRPLI